MLRVALVTVSLSLLALLYWVTAIGASVPAAPQLVSPAGESDILTVDEPCPTFSWAGVRDARAYDLTVVRLGAGKKAPDNPLESDDLETVLETRLPRSATAWTPTGDQCLNGSETYGWSVRAVRDKGPGSWARASLFKVDRFAGTGRLGHALRDYVADLAADGEVSPEDAERLRRAIEPLAGATRTERLAGTPGSSVVYPGLREDDDVGERDSSDYRSTSKVASNAINMGNGNLLVGNTMGVGADPGTGTTLEVGGNTDVNGLMRADDAVSLGTFIANGATTLALASGQVGVGTGSPAAKLDVNGGTRVRGNINVDSTANISGNLGLGTSNPTDRLAVNGNAVIGSQLEVGSTANFEGNVGIGTASPVAKLDIFGSQLFNSTLGLFPTNGGGGFCGTACSNAADGAGFKAGSGVCLAGWDSNGNSIGCGGSGAQDCLCAGDR